MILYTVDEVIRMLEDEQLKFGTDKELAIKLGISQQYLSDILHGKRGPGKAVLDYFGLKKYYVYGRKDGSNQILRSPGSSNPGMD